MPRYPGNMYSVERLLRVSRGDETPHSTIDQPLEHLTACHGRIEERLQVLERAGQHLETRAAEALEAVDGCFRYFESSGVAHTEDEEHSVFPRLRPHLSPEELAEIEMLERQHREADALYSELKDIAARLKQNAAAPGLAERYRSVVERFAALYRSHIAFEDRELIRVARRDLDSAELAAISEEMKQRRGFLSRPGTP